jgi:hypothetical protein
MPKNGSSTLPDRKWLDALDRARGRAHHFWHALDEIADLVDGLEGLTAQQMQMRGVSPVRLLAQARDIARTAMREAEYD